MEHLNSAHSAERSTPSNDETQQPSRAIGFQDTNQSRSAEIIPFSGTSSNSDKPNLIARLARAGHLVHEGSEHSFTVVHPRWGMSRYCADFGALQSFARAVGVQHG